MKVSSLFRTGIFFAVSSCYLAAYAWDLSITEEDWGPTCVVSERTSDGNTLKLVTAKDDFNPIMLLSGYVDSYGVSFPITLSVDNSVPSLLTGTMPEYFSDLEVAISLEQIKQLKSGQILAIKVADSDTMTFDLGGSGKAIKAFLTCAGR